MARYLRPEEEVVPFRVRSELDELLTWCGTAGHVAARLVAGDGGAGKTRLALRLSQELVANGWQPLWVPRGRERLLASAVQVLGRPCVVLVDYAETRDGLGGLLTDVAGASGGPDVRVVMLARSSGEWWQRLVTGGDDRVAKLLGASPVVLGPIAAEGGQGELFDEALTAFAQKLGVDCPDVPLVLTDPEPVVLVVHAAALLAVLDHARGSGSGMPRSVADVLDGVLAHEGRYWAQSAAARGLDLDVSVQRLAMVVSCMIGADSESSAADLMLRLPDMADSAERRGKVARWLHDLNPEARSATGAREWIGPLRPDRVAEHLVVTELNRQPELIPRIFTGLGQDRAARALTVLARAAHTEPSALNLLHGALTADLENLAAPALLVAVETNPALGELLGKALDCQPVSAGTLEHIANTAPYPSFAVAGPAAVVLQRLADDSANEGKRARWLVDLGRRLVDLGRREEALAAIEQATGIYRQLTEKHPGTFLADLARSLNNQSACLGELGEWKEALAAIQQAVTIRRQLAEDGHDAFLADLARSLNNQSTCLARLGQREEALAATEQAIGICSQLAETRPNAFRTYLAESLNDQSLRLADLGRREEALAPSEQATAIYRQLAEGRPDAFLADLARSLSNQSFRLAELERRNEALEATNQATAIYRQLAEGRPGAFLIYLASALSNQSLRLAALGQSEEALAPVGQAIRQLAEAHPDTFLADLASALNQSVWLTEQGQSEQEVLAPVGQAIRQLAEAHPDTLLPVLASALKNAADLHNACGQDSEAKATEGGSFRYKPYR